MTYVLGNLPPATHVMPESMEHIGAWAYRTRRYHTGLALARRTGKPALYAIEVRHYADPHDLLVTWLYVRPDGHTRTVHQKPFVRFRSGGMQSAGLIPFRRATDAEKRWMEGPQ